MRPLRAGQVDPARRENIPELAVGKKSDVPAQRREPMDQPIRSIGHFSWRFPTREAIFESVPAGSRLANIVRGPAFVIAIIPFRQVGLDHCDFAQPGEAAGLAGPLQRTGEYVSECNGGQPRRQFSGLSRTRLRQRQICRARVLTGQGPGRLAMTDEMQSGVGRAVVRDGAPPSPVNTLRSAPRGCSWRARTAPVAPI